MSREVREALMLAAQRRAARDQERYDKIAAFIIGLVTLFVMGWVLWTLWP